METNQIESKIPDLAEISASKIDEWANEKGSEYARSIKTNQIRNVFSHINLIKTKFRNNNNAYNDEIETSLVLLKPKLAYAAGRQNQIKPFQRFMFEIIDSVVRSKHPEKAIENFFYLVEAIVAYHKFYGGKES